MRRLDRHTNMRPVRLNSAAAALLFLCGCATSTGAVGPASSTPAASESPPVVVGTASASPATVVTPFQSGHVKPSPTPTYSGSRTLIESDSGATIKLKVGDVVKVSLPSEYDQPNAQSDALTRDSSSGGYPSGQRVEATFRADKSGRTDIMSSTDYACLHTTPMCGIPQRLWTVHVLVS
ncbi:MAG: hypothetical protein E6G46_01435 [Actinobacteria bacterium]|nr:MAG: hypothetical protein E6G46_01435 [Actinomycetota bacterium]